MIDPAAHIAGNSRKSGPEFVAHALQSRLVAIEADYSRAAFDQQACDGLTDSICRAGHHNNSVMSAVHSLTVNASR